MKHIRVKGFDLDKRCWVPPLGFHRTKSDGRTLCGAPPTDADHGRRMGEGAVRGYALRPDWIADLCPACVEAMRTLIGRTA